MVWGAIGGTLALGYWALSRSIKVQQEEIDRIHKEEENRERGEELAKI